MSLRNSQNLHCTIWPRVVDVIFVYLFLSFTTWSTGTLLGFLVGRFSVVVSFQSLLCNSVERLWKLSFLGGPIAR